MRRWSSTCFSFLFLFVLSRTTREDARRTEGGHGCKGFGVKDVTTKGGAEWRRSNQTAVPFLFQSGSPLKNTKFRNQKYFRRSVSRCISLSTSLLFRFMYPIPHQRGVCLRWRKGRQCPRWTVHGDTARAPTKVTRNPS